MRKRLQGRARQEGVYPVIMTGPDSFILHGQEYTGKPSIAGRLGEDDRAFVAFRGIGRRLPVIFAKATQGSDQRNSPFASILYGLWDCPEGGPWIAWGASAAQPAIDWDGSETLSQSIDRILSGGGTFEYANQKTRTEPTGLVRYTIGENEFFAAVWGKYLTNGATAGSLVFRVRNLTTSSWLASALVLSPDIGRIEGPAGFLPNRREGQLFHTQNEAGAHFMFLVFPGSAFTSRNKGRQFWVFPPDAPGSAYTYTFTTDNILDRPVEDPEADPIPDPETGKIYNPIERSGSIAVANMCLLECYWTAWQAADEDLVSTDMQSTDRAVMHLYKIDGATGGVTSYNKSLRAALVDAFSGGDDLDKISSCGIFDANEVLYKFEGDDGISTVAAGYQRQMIPSRWPFHPTRNSFMFDVAVQLKTSGDARVPRALTGEIKLSDGSLALLGTPRQPNATIEEPYTGFIDAQMALLEADLPAYDYGGEYILESADTGVPIMFLSYETESCDYYPRTDPEHTPPVNWQYGRFRGAVQEQFWVGLNATQAATVAATPVEGSILFFPLPSIGTQTPSEDNQGENSGFVPAGIIDDGKKYSFEARPQRYVASLEPIANAEYDGPVEYPNGIEETNSWPTWDDWDPGVTPNERYEACFQGIGELPTKYHTSIAIEAHYDQISFYYRSFLIVHDGSTATEVDVTCRIKLSDFRFDSYGLFANIFQWAIKGGILFILRLWPGGWTDSTSYADEAAATAKLEPHLELRDVTDLDTVLARQRLRPAADTGVAWNPVLNYAPHMLTGVGGDGKPWAHVWHEWKASGDTHPRHAVTQAIWGGEDGLAVSEDVSSSAERPTGRPSLPESYVSMAVDSSVYWIDDCQSIKVKSI